MHDGMMWHGGWMWIVWLLLTGVVVWLVIVTARVVGRGPERDSRAKGHDDRPHGTNG